MAEAELKKFNLSVLIVEDESNIRSVFSEILNRRFQNVFSADNGQSAMDIYQMNKIDIIITDINMPVLNGLDMIKQIRNTNKNIPIIVMTAHNELQYIQKANALKVDSFITKPIQKMDLLAALDKAIKNAGYNREYEA